MFGLPSLGDSHLDSLKEDVLPNKKTIPFNAVNKFRSMHFKKETLL